MSRVGAGLGTFLLPWSMAHLGVGATMLIAAGITAIGAAVAQALAPETRGMSLSETSAGLAHGHALAPAGNWLASAGHDSTFGSFHPQIGKIARNDYLMPSLRRLLIDHGRIGRTFFRSDPAAKKQLDIARGSARRDHQRHRAA